MAAPRHDVLIEAPLNLVEDHEPEPDLTAVTARSDAHPTAADTLLVIEVADGILSDDLATTLRLDQQAGIANDSVVDVGEPIAFFLLQGSGVSTLPARLRQAVQAPWRSCRR